VYSAYSAVYFSKVFLIYQKACSSDRSEVDAFYAAAMGIGGKDDGKPGLRPQYHPNYYAAFVIDPDGYRIEAVCHNPQ
jgi:predicted lactoylglutathione lyase